jgi:hypothetical protein
VQYLRNFRLKGESAQIASFDAAGIENGVGGLNMMQVSPRTELGKNTREGFWQGQAVRTTAWTSLLAGMIALTGTAGAQSTVPDSQVEANVLRALAGASDLASQSISTNTVYGVVTLSGTVQDEAQRTKAENLAANAEGVKKVVDELQIGSAAAANQGAPGPGMVLQSDGTYAPAQPDQSGSVPPGSPAPGTAPAAGAAMNDPDNDQAAYAQQPTAGQPNGQTPNGQAPYGQAQANPPYSPNGAPPAYPAYPQGGYPPQNGYPQPQNGYPPTGYAQNGAGQPWGGQVAGQPVVVPAGTMVRVRVDRLLASDKLHPGDVFNGFVANDVVAGGYVAIPRGAAVQGKVVDAKTSGAVSGRGELSVQLVSVTLGGKVYSVVSDIWSRSGPDKTGQTVGSAAGLGVMGALIGAVAGQGAGAAIGAGAGAAAGVGLSAASPKGQVVVPPEGMLTFHLTAPAEVKTVSEQEMQRLAYGVPTGPPVGQGYRRPMYAQPYGYPGYPPPPPPLGYPPY